MAPAKRGANGGDKRQPLWDSDKDLKAEDLDLSTSEDESDEEGDREQEIADAVLDYIQSARRRSRKQSKKDTSTTSKRKSKKPVPGEEADLEGGDSDEEDSDFDFDAEDSEEEQESDEDGLEVEEEADGNLGAGDSEGDDGDIEEEVEIDSEGAEEEEADDDPASDSSEDVRPNRNTIGDVPLEWYKDEEHAGYDVDGKPLIRKGRRDALDRLLARSDSAKEWRTVYDEYNDEEIVLSKEEMSMIQRIRAGKFAHIEVNPFEPENDWFSRDTEIMPLSGAPEPKRRFIPSKWEEKRVVKLVRAMRKGWLKRTEPEEAPTTYLMWQDDGKHCI